MLEHDIDIKKVSKLGATASIEPGYLVFCKSRAGNHEFLSGSIE
jgi:hypothetical protein